MKHEQGPTASKKREGVNFYLTLFLPMFAMQIIANSNKTHLLTSRFLLITYLIQVFICFLSSNVLAPISSYKLLILFFFKYILLFKMFSLQNCDIYQNEQQTCIQFPNAVKNTSALKCCLCKKIIRDGQMDTPTLICLVGA